MVVEYKIRLTSEIKPGNNNSLFSKLGKKYNATLIHDENRHKAILCVSEPLSEDDYFRLLGNPTLESIILPDN